MTRNCPFHGQKDNELLDTFYNGLTNASRSYIDSIAGTFLGTGQLNKLRNYWIRWLRIMITGLLMKKMIQNIIPKERGILTLSNEVMKEALIAIEEKGIKSIDLLRLSERGIKLHIDEPVSLFK
jgi:hypothetical protein